MTESADSGRPVLRVIKGDPTPAELAALIAVVSARAATAHGDDRRVPAPAYADPAARLRAPVRVGPGAWVASGRVPGTRTKANW